MSDSAMNVCFIGGGNMAQAIVRGLLAAGHAPDRISVGDPDADRRSEVGALDASIRVGADNTAAADGADVIVFAVKPQVLPDVARQLRSAAEASGALVISVAAGITLSALADRLGPDTRIVRVMPNQPALIGAGVSVLTPSAAVDDADRARADYILGAAGTVIWLDDEGLMDAVTAVSGSGPAYFYLLMELIADVGEELGLDAGTALKLTLGTALGAALVANSEESPLAVLRERVTSPGGTTAAALAVLEQAGIRDIFRKALAAARDRSAELGRAENH